MSHDAITIQEIEAAYRRIAHRVRTTEIRPLEALVAPTGAKSILAKLENTQEIGAFKIRGASNAVERLSEEVGKRGVLADSSGNHAQGLAKAAAVRGFPAHIVMPEGSSPLKVEKTRALGAKVYFCSPIPGGRQVKLLELQKETGGTIIPSFNHPDVIAGQGTAALEMTHQIKEPCDIIITPLGGGGLISGTAIAIKAYWPNAQIIGVEPEGANDTERSLQLGTRTPHPNPKSIADGLLTMVGELTFPIIQSFVDVVVSVTDTQIREAVIYSYRQLGMIIEPSSAVVIAALQSGKISVRGKKVGMIITGENIDVEKFISGRA